MKPLWLLLTLSLKLTSVLSYCPKKCICLWYTDNTLTVNCSGSGQKEVPQGIDLQVLSLDLSFNYSQQLEIAEEIDLSNNIITEAYFGESFKFLEIINLSHNYIEDLGKVEVQNLPRLKKLDLSYNSKLSETSGLKSKSLEYLNLRHCLISSIKEDFMSNLSKIRVLDLSFNFFQSLNNIRSETLETLDASHGRLENLTHLEIFNLPNLKKLNVSFNPNLKINFSFENSCWDVKELDLSNSELTSLDDMFPFCSLEVLNVSFNKIKIIEVRTFFNNCELNSVNLSKNQISEIANLSFTTTEKLKILDLSANEIQNVNFSLYLKQVLTLDLSKNRITDITNLVLKKVINLNLSENKIKELSVNFNENMPKIQKLNLSFNKIKHINKINSKTMTHIDLSYCKISSIELKAFESTEELMEINLKGNKLTKLDFKIFKGLENLKNLFLSKNQWACECQSQEFKGMYEFLTVDRPVTSVQELFCVKTNQTWRNTCLDSWHKEKEWKKTVYSLTVSLAIALIVVAVIFFCKYFNDKKQLEETHREARERRENIGRRLSNFQSSSHIVRIREPEEIPNRSSTPPPNYEAALLLPKLTEDQKNLAFSTLSIASPSITNEERLEENEEDEEIDETEETEETTETSNPISQQNE